MKRKTREKAGELLGSAKLRRTVPRIEVLGILLRVHRPQTAEQIAGRLSPPAPNRVTIYRILERFLEAGLVHRAYLDERTWHYELADKCTDEQCHPHFTCTNCGVTRCLVGLSVPVVKGLKEGFVTHRQQIRLEGLCPACA